ncbi:Glucuronokinase 1 (AtGlcAK1) [Durusdinium trenchii]|uniref:Glucuronokinase 1 (AtGlcAK1) n=1 Tax=Durusdinium trenchii TaxID=1381693 RepID=A0ABP0QCA3_9DINO
MNRSGTEDPGVEAQEGKTWGAAIGSDPAVGRGWGEARQARPTNDDGEKPGAGRTREKLQQLTSTSQFGWWSGSPNPPKLGGAGRGTLLECHLADAPGNVPQKKGVGISWHLITEGGKRTQRVDSRVMQGIERSIDISARQLADLAKSEVLLVYQGLVFMDFDAEHMKENGYGRYERLSRSSFEWLSSLPFFIAFEADPSDSGKIHSNVRTRWDAGEAEVISAMRHFAELAVKAKAAIENRDQKALAELMDQNFNLRRKLYGDACLGSKNLEMIEICRRCNCAVKFPGSGGAVLGLCRSEDGSDPWHPIQEALEAENFVFCPLDLVMPD